VSGTGNRGIGTVTRTRTMPSTVRTLTRAPDGAACRAASRTRAGVSERAASRAAARAASTHLTWAAAAAIAQISSAATVTRTGITTAASAVT
jgi:hypothetical protein